MTQAPPIYAHRLGTEYGPESSRLALDRSLEKGVAGLECDVCLSADGVVMGIHDPFLEISTDRKGWAHEHAAAELDEARLLGPDGEPSDEQPMRLDELLERVDGRVPLQLDVKAYADPELARRTAEAVCDAAQRHDAGEWVEVISFFAGACVAAARRGFRTRIVTWSDYLPGTLAGWAAEQGFVGLSCEGFVLGPELAAAAEEADLSLSIGAVNSVEQFEKLRSFEPEILVSDRPDELGRELLALAG